jgi:hypothetical protein
MRRLILCTVAVAAATACGPSWIVVRQANPNPFAEQKRFSLAIDYSGMAFNGKNEAQYVAKGPEQLAGWNKTKEAFTTGFTTTFFEKAKRAHLEIGEGAPHTVIVAVGDIDPGYYAHFSQNNSTTPITVRLVAADGTALDEFTVQASTKGSIGHASPDSRIHEDSIKLGELVVAYLKDRTKPTK